MSPQAAGGGEVVGPGLKTRSGNLQGACRKLQRSRAFPHAGARRANIRLVAAGQPLGGHSERFNHSTGSLASVKHPRILNDESFTQ